MAHWVHELARRIFKRRILKRTELDSLHFFSVLQDGNKSVPTLSISLFCQTQVSRSKRSKASLYLFLESSSDIQLQGATSAFSAKRNSAAKQRPRSHSQGNELRIIRERKENFGFLILKTSLAFLLTTFPFAGIPRLSITCGTVVIMSVRAYNNKQANKQQDHISVPSNQKTIKQTMTLRWWDEVSSQCPVDNSK